MTLIEQLEEIGRIVCPYYDACRKGICEMCKDHCNANDIAVEILQAGYIKREGYDIRKEVVENVD